MITPIDSVKPSAPRYGLLWPLLLGAVSLVVLVFWFFRGLDHSLMLRVPGTDQAPGGEAAGGGNPVLAGKVIPGPGTPSSLPGAWPQFRGLNRDGIGADAKNLLRSWPESGPRELWSTDVGDGYAGPVVLNGRVYLMDYDIAKKQDCLRCLSLEDGREIWRYAYPVSVKRNHGMSRTVPAADSEFVVAMGPKCHVVCVDAVSGQLRWGLDLVRDYGATIPPWYAGQCPLIDKGTVVLAPGGDDALLLAANEKTGEVLWKTPNPRGWKMTHSSIVATEIGGERQYIYCGNNGVVGVSAKTGQILWDSTDWKISLANVPSPIPVEGGRLFFSGGYNAGSLMMQVEKKGDVFAARTLFHLEPEVFGATQQTPILFDGHIYGIRPDGKLACIDLDGKPIWSGDGKESFGLGPLLIADGILFAMNDSGLLRVLDASPEKFRVLARAQVLKGHESWGPMALAGGRLLVRDLTRMACLDVGTGTQSK